MKTQLLRWSGWFFGCNALLFWLIGLRYLFQIIPLSLPVINATSLTLAWFFILLAYIGQLTLLAFIPCLAVITLIFLRVPSRFIFICAVTLAALSLTALILDTFLYALFRFHINSAVISLFFSGQMAQIFHFTVLEWTYALGVFLGLLILEMTLAFWVFRKIIHGEFFQHARQLAAIPVICLLLSYYVFIFAGVYPALGITQQAFALPFYDEILSSLLPVSNSFERIIQLGAGNFIQPKQADHKLHYPLHSLIFTPSTKPLNIVIIVIDTWRYDMLNSQSMPLLNQFADSAWRYNHHFSGGNSTQPGIFSLFYGLPASYWPAMTTQKQSPLLIQALQKQNYHMGIFASAELTQPAFNKNVFLNIPQLQIETPGTNSFERDIYITDEFKRFIQTSSKNQPFFSFLFYDSAHSYCDGGNPVHKFQPIIAVCNHLALTNRSDPTPYVNRYKNALVFIDQLINEDLQLLKQQGFLNHTLIIITGDHGNEFNDNHLNYWEHASNFTPYQVETPFILYWPGKSSAVIDRQTSHYDVAPTLLQTVLGCQNPPIDYSIGRSLINIKEPAAPYLLVNSYIDFGIIEKNRINNFYPTGNYLITDLGNKPLAGATLHWDTIQQVIADMKRYYSNG